MTKAAEMAKVTVKGGFQLLWGLVISTGISAVGTIYLANLLSPTDMGLYTLALAAPNLIGVFRDWGVNSAIIRDTAQFNSERKIIQVKKMLTAGLLFEVVAGVVLTAITLLLWLFYRKLPTSITRSNSSAHSQSEEKKRGTTTDIRSLLKYGLPLSA